MANPSIFAAFERMWQQIVAALGRKADVDAIPAIDDTISDTSTNPVQNKVIKTYVDTKVAGIVDTAPETLNTLNELSAALGDDPNFATTVATQIGGKVDKVSGKGLSTNDYTTTEKNKLAGIAEGANNYTHPSYTAKSNGFYKVTVNNTGHVSGTTAVTKADITGLGIPAQDTTYSVATTSANGLMSTSDKTKLNGIADNAEVNQNAFSNVKVGSTTIAADSKTDTLTLVAGSNVTITPDATNDKVTIAATDTVYTHPSHTAKTSGFYKVTVDSQGHVSGTAAVAKSDITALGIPAQDTTYSAATTSTNGLMSSSDKSKLDGIASGATANTGTITGVSANGTSVATSGVANIPAASTSKYGVTKLSSSTSSTSTSLAATASAVKSAYDLANTANTAASTAKTTADTASSTASEAQTTANAALPKAGGTMTGKLTAQNNTSYTTKQVRNIFLIADGASLPSGANGDICLVYTP